MNVRVPVAMVVLLTTTSMLLAACGADPLPPPPTLPPSPTSAQAEFECAMCECPPTPTHLELVIDNVKASDPEHSEDWIIQDMGNRVTMTNTVTGFRLEAEFENGEYGGGGCCNTCPDVRVVKTSVTVLPPGVLTRTPAPTSTP